MNDDDRDKIDSEVQEFIRTYADRIKGVKKLISASDDGSKLVLANFVYFIYALFCRSNHISESATHTQETNMWFFGKAFKKYEEICM